MASTKEIIIYTSTSFPKTVNKTRSLKTWLDTTKISYMEVNLKDNQTAFQSLLKRIKNSPLSCYFFKNNEYTSDFDLVHDSLPVVFLTKSGQFRCTYRL